MRDEYDIKNLNPRANPYAKSLKKTITINIDENVINYFKEESNHVGVPYRWLLRVYQACLASASQLFPEEEPL